jgi:hypothetical protein
MAILILLLASGVAYSQAVILDVSGAQPGKYYYQVQVAAGGVITVSPVTQVIRLTDPKPGPSPTPDTLTELSKKIRDASLAVIGDAEREATANALAAIYREIASKTKDGTIKGKDQIEFAVKAATDMLLTARKSTSSWAPVRTAMSEYWTKLAQEGAPDAQYANLLNEAAIGLDASTNGEPQIDLAMILQIVKLVLELLEKFFP